MHNNKYETKCVALNENGEIVKYIARISKDSFSMPGVGYVKVLWLRKIVPAKDFNRKLILTLEATDTAIKMGKRVEELYSRSKEIFSSFTAGDRVKSPSFGTGKVMEILDYGSENGRAKVCFSDGRTKILLIKYANLKLLNGKNETSV